MPRSRSDIDLLMQEARAIELLANEAEVAPHNLQAYWDISAELLNLVTDIEQLQDERSNVTYEDPELLMLKRRLRDIAARLATISEG